MKFIDSHAHLNDPAFNPDRSFLLTRTLPEASLCACVEIGCSPDEWQPALDLAKQYPSFIYPVLGVHPEYAPLFQPALKPQLAQLLQLPQVVAVGEIGLDYTCLDQSPRETQQPLLADMLALASDAQKPVVLHVRRQAEDYSVYEDCFTQLKHHFQPASFLTYPGVLHCFCARYEEAQQALDQGFLLGINGCFTYKKNEYIREAVKKAGADKIILETDCPYLSPQGKRGQRNDPSNIPLLAQWVADYLNMPVEKLAEIALQNTKKLYNI